MPWYSWEGKAGVTPVLCPTWFTGAWLLGGVAAFSSWWTCSHSFPCGGCGGSVAAGHVAQARSCWKMCYFWWVAFCPEQEGVVVQLGAAQFLCLVGVCLAGDGGYEHCCSMGSSLRWHSHGDLELNSQGGTQGCFPSSSAVLLQDSASVEETWVGFLWFSVLCFFNKWFIALQHTRGSEGTVPLERAGLCAAAGCSLMDPSYAAGTAAWAGKQLLWFYSVNPSM